MLIAAALFHDLRQYRSHMASGEPFDANNRLIDLALMLTPFLVFFYPDPFWTHFGVALALWGVGAAALWLLYSVRLLAPGIELQLAVMPGLILIVGLGYLLFYHQGPAAEAQQVAEPASEWLLLGVVWYWWAYGLAWLVGMLLSRFKDGVFLSGLTLVLASAVLPFFTGSYWLSLGLGVLVTGLSLPLINRDPSNQARGANFLMLLLLALFVTFLSIVTYAIFF